jgi:hypothetical protein
MYISTKGGFKIAYIYLDSGPSLAMADPMQCKSDFSVLSDQLGTFFISAEFPSKMLLMEMELDS